MQLGAPTFPFPRGNKKEKPPPTPAVERLGVLQAAKGVLFGSSSILTQVTGIGRLLQASNVVLGLGRWGLPQNKKPPPGRPEFPPGLRSLAPLGLSVPRLARGAVCAGHGRRPGGAGGGGGGQLDLGPQQLKGQCGISWLTWPWFKTNGHPF